MLSGKSTKGVRRHRLAIPVGNPCGNLGIVDVADQDIDAFSTSPHERHPGVKVKGKRNALATSLASGPNPKRPACTPALASRIHSTTRLKPIARIHRFENDAQDVIELETIHQRIADVLNTGGQDRLGVDSCGSLRSCHSGIRKLFFIEQGPIRANQPPFQR
jgi:hypothetical protein